MTTKTVSLTAAGVTSRSEHLASALVLGAVRGANGDPAYDGGSLRSIADQMAREAGNDIGGVLVDLAVGFAAGWQEHIDAGKVTVDDVRTLLRESRGSSAEVAPPAA